MGRQSDPRPAGGELQAGFTRVEAYGSDGGPLTLDSTGMIAVAYG
jgi:hypothetical protein